jgi:hypothetical protein
MTRSTLALPLAPGTTAVADPPQRRSNQLDPQAATHLAAGLGMVVTLTDLDLRHARGPRPKDFPLA